MSTNKGVNERSKYVTQVQQQRPESPLVTPLGLRVNTRFEDGPLVEFMYIVFTRMPGESYRRWLKSLLLYFVLRISSAS